VRSDNKKKIILASSSNGYNSSRIHRSRGIEHLPIFL
jgi:hypothetical protein